MHSTSCMLGMPLNERVTSPVGEIPGVFISELVIVKDLKILGLYVRHRQRRFICA